MNDVCGCTVCDRMESAHMDAFGHLLMLMEPWILMPSWVLLLIGDGPGQTLSPWPRNHPS